MSEAGVVVREVARLKLALDEVASGDMFAARVPIKGTDEVIRSSNVGATREKGEPWHARKPGGKSIWFSWTAPNTGPATFSTAGSDFDTLLAVYTGGRIDQLEPEAASEDSGGYLTSQVQLYAEAGQVYQIAVDGFAGAEGIVVLSWNQGATTVGSPQIITEPEDQIAYVGGKAKFAVVARGRGLTYQWYFNDTRLARATNASLLLTDVSSRHAGNYRVEVGVKDRILSSLSARLEVYHIYSGDPATPELGRDKLEDLAVPPQSLLPVLGRLEPSRQFQPLGSAPSSGFTIVRWGTTGGSSSQSFETGTCGQIGGASQWYRLVLSKPGVCTLSTDGSNFDTLMAVFKETGNLMDPLSDPVACDDNSGADGKTSWLQFAAEKTGSYFVLVDGVDGASGTVKLTTLLEPWIGAGQVDRNAAGDFHFQMEVAKGWIYRIDATTNLDLWVPLINTNAPQGVLDFVDQDWDLYQQKYFRVMPVP
jgi:hypothetical protein